MVVILLIVWIGDLSRNHLQTFVVNSNLSGFRIAPLEHTCILIGQYWSTVVQKRTTKLHKQMLYRQIPGIDRVEWTGHVINGICKFPNEVWWLYQSSPHTFIGGWVYVCIKFCIRSSLFLWNKVHRMYFSLWRLSMVRQLKYILLSRWTSFQTKSDERIQI